MIYKTPMLETERLLLKRGQKQDYQKVYEYDFTKLRDIANEFEYVKTDLKDIEGFETAADEIDEFYDWIIYLKENNEPIGNITGDREIKELKSTELAFNLHPYYWGKDYMKEAIICIMQYLFENGYDNIMCGYSEGNTKSKRLIEKLGFEYYTKIENAWNKYGISITDYKTIMSKEKFENLYKQKLK